MCLTILSIIAFIEMLINLCICSIRLKGVDKFIVTGSCFEWLIRAKLSVYPRMLINTYRLISIKSTVQLHLHNGLYIIKFHLKIKDFQDLRTGELNSPMAIAY